MTTVIAEIPKTMAKLQFIFGNLCHNAGVQLLPNSIYQSSVRLLQHLNSKPNKILK